MRKLTVSVAVSLIVTGCGGGGGSDSSPTVTVMSTTSKTPSITLSLSKNNINQVQNSILTWDVTDATSCTGSKELSGVVSLTGSKIVNYNNNDQVFELTCTGSGGTSTKSVTLTSKKVDYTLAGTWFPVTPNSLHTGYNGNLANTFHNLFKLGNNTNYSIAITGWGYKGWESKSTETAMVNVAVFEPNTNGLLVEATKKYINDPTTYGGASVNVADINNDNVDDLVFISHNETPIAPRPSTVFYGSSQGTFRKETLSEQLAAHDAQLSTDDGKVRIHTSVVTGHPRNAYFESNGTNLISVKVPGISFNRINWVLVGNMSQTIVTNKNGDKVLVTAGGCKEVVINPSDCPAYTINTFPYNGEDITNYTPVQSITPYLSTLPEYSNIKAMDGLGKTHVYRVWSLDLNNDGHEDVLSAQSMWHQDSNSFPVALQVLINDGKNNLHDKTKTLNAEMPTVQSNIDPSPMFVDIDGSGIKTLFFSGVSYGNTNEQSNYVMLNDGTGKLYVALNTEFESVVKDLYTFLNESGKTLPDKTLTKDGQFPKFIAVPQANGSVNFLVEFKSSALNQESGKSQAVWYYVNAPLQYNPKTDYTKNVSVNDRNFSNNIRTWAGDDTINDTNAVVGTRIDGGLGKNKVTYNGASTNYNVTKNNDGTYRVTSSANNIDDTLVRIHNIVFTDKTITLE